MFASRPKPAPFPGLPPLGTPPIYAPPGTEQPPVMGAGMTPRAPSFFEQGGVGRAIAGAIGDTLLQQARMQPIFASAQQQARAQQLQQQRYAQQQQDEQAQWLARQEYERANPKPINNDTVADFDFISRTLGPEAAKRFLTNKTEAPPLVQHNADGTLSVFPAGMVPRGTVAPPSTPAPGTVEGGYRFKGGNPSDPTAWEPVAGGATPQASRTFP